jgi:glycosyltransferase involved in cell wall biosynthesis
MKLVIVSSSPLIKKNSDYFAYSPYVKELVIWSKYCDEIAFTCPIWNQDNGLLVSEIPFSIDKLYEIKGFNIKSVNNFLKAIQYSFLNFYLIYKSMLWADHIHLRCPGNIGLMGCFVQILFPNKVKTAKYAGNWDLNAKQPWSYNLQKWILSATFLTRNMQVLVYGEWEGSSKNIKSFFTATYKEDDKTPVPPKSLESKIKFIFVGTLSPGKQPLYAIKIIEKLQLLGYNVELEIFGAGIENDTISKYILKNKLENQVVLKGNQSSELIKKAYQESHFLLLPSKSEGWPKVVAEAMFWGCLPIATKVSCVPNMLDNGNRGILLEMNLEQDVDQIINCISNQQEYNNKVRQSIDWSRKYTLDLFEIEIKALLKK